MRADRVPNSTIANHAEPEPGVPARPFVSYAIDGPETLLAKSPDGKVELEF